MAHIFLMSERLLISSRMQLRPLWIVQQAVSTNFVAGSSEDEHVFQ